MKRTLLKLALLSSNLSGSEPAANTYLSSIHEYFITLSDVFNFKSKSVGILNFSDLASNYLLEENNYYGSLNDYNNNLDIWSNFNLETRLLYRQGSYKRISQKLTT